VFLAGLNPRTARAVERSAASAAPDSRAAAAAAASLPGGAMEPLEIQQADALEAGRRPR